MTDQQLQPPPMPEWDPNAVGIADGGLFKGQRAILPSLEAVMGPSVTGSGKAWSIDHYVSVMESAVSKAISPAPSALSYARMTYMPEQTNSGVLPWPGISPESIRKIVTENIAPHLIIGMRCDDVIRYSTLSTHNWRPGWRMQLAKGLKHPTASDERDMRDAEEFLMNSNVETGFSGAIHRDQMGLTDFQRFLSALTRDSLTFGANAIWTKRDSQDKVIEYALMPAGNIRLCPHGYKGFEQDEPNPELFAVSVDEVGSVVNAFTRKELTWYVRNPCIDPVNGGANGYPVCEIELCMRFIQGFQNALDMNLDTFNRNGIPNGMLVLKGGGWVQRQVDALQRMWQNAKKGITKAWAMPVIGAPTNGDIELIDFQDLKGTDVRYQDLMNMIAGGMCTIFRFPVRRLGYRISGKGPDSQPVNDAAVDLVDEDDPGLSPLLTHIENIVNEYLIRPRWPHLAFAFSGKNPKEDNREYEARKDAQTWDESRAHADYSPLVEYAEKLGKMAGLTGQGLEDFKDLAALMALSPVNPNLSGPYSTVMGAYVAAKYGGKDEAGSGGNAATPGNRMTASKDPAKSAKHGKTSGVRRNSRAEKKKAFLKGLAEDVDAAAAETEPDPTQAQIEAGNYRKPKINIQGLTIAIENPRGGKRRGVAPDGTEWEVVMPAHYGYFLGTLGADGDHVDVYIGPNPESNKVYIVDQVDTETQEFDEHKIMIGFDSIVQANKIYDAGFSDGRGAERRGAVTYIDFNELKEWLDDGDTETSYVDPYKLI